MQALPIPTLL